MRKTLPYIIIGLLIGALVWALCRKQDEPVARVEYKYIRESDTVRVVDSVYVEKHVSFCCVDTLEFLPEDSVFVYEEPDVLIKVCSEKRPNWVKYKIGIVDTIVVYRDRVVSLSDFSQPVVLPEVKSTPRWAFSAFAGPGVCLGDGVHFGACVGVGVTYRFGK